jgi:hypothetical protein
LQAKVHASEVGGAEQMNVVHGQQLLTNHAVENEPKAGKTSKEEKISTK